VKACTIEQTVLLSINIGTTLHLFPYHRTILQLLSLNDPVLVEINVTRVGYSVSIKEVDCVDLEGALKLEVLIAFSYYYRVISIHKSIL
jgi:hypothetical protein